MLFKLLSAKVYVNIIITIPVQQSQSIKVWIFAIICKKIRKQKNQLGVKTKATDENTWKNICLFIENFHIKVTKKIINTTMSHYDNKKLIDTWVIKHNIKSSFLQNYSNALKVKRDNII